MSLERSPTLRSSEEENGLRRALEIVKKQGDFYKRQQGLSPFSFALGLFNVGFTGFCLGRFVEYYWVWQVLKSLVLNYLSYSIKLKNHQRLYLMDLCHWLSFAYSIVGTISLAAWAIPGWKEWLAPVTSSPYVFRACFCLANGPLGWAVPALANALILHSVEHTAALFIHISPPMVTWALRWHPEEHEAAFPGILPMPGLDDTTNGSGVGYVELITPAVTVYAVWWVVHVVWLVSHGRWHGHSNPSGSSHDTVFHMTMRSIPRLGRWIGYVNDRPADIGPCVRYMMVHAAACLAVTALAPVFWYSLWAHTAFILLLLASSIWNGSRRYYGMMTSSYERRLRALLPEYARKNAPSEAPKRHDHAD